MKTMKSLIKLIAFAFVLAVAAKANQINGTLAIGLGSVSLDNPSLGLATTAMAGTGTVSPVSTGDFTTYIWSNVAYSQFSWNPSSAPVIGLWTIPGGSFDLSSLQIISQDNFFLNLSGTGVLNFTGFDATPGTWSYQITQSNGAPAAQFGFQSTNASLPDGGTTVILLGAGLLSISLAARRLKRA